MYRRAVIFLAIFVLTSCTRETSQPIPTRTSSLTDSLINHSLLPDSWLNIEELIQEGTCHMLDYDYYHCKEVQSISIRADNGSIDQTLARFDSVDVAARTYRRHAFTGNTAGKYGESFRPLDGFTYKSPIADQFQVLCGSFNDKNLPQNVANCYIEAQYAEVLSTTHYSSMRIEQTANELEMIAKAIDGQMAIYLGEK